ncbi:MAG: radical SAM protein [Nitrospinota bacterium]|nr:radical SAM protein [Nitrospinota bacterium]
MRSKNCFGKIPKSRLFKEKTIIMISRFLKRFLLVPLAKNFCRWLETHYQFPQESFYCEHLWLRVSIHQDGRMEPCSCAISKMEPQRPMPSIYTVWNNSIYKNTRNFLTDKMLDKGGIPFKDQDIFDCCVSCPLAPKQRLDPIHLKNVWLFIFKNFQSKFLNKPLLFLKKLNNFRKLVIDVNGGNSKINAYPIFANIDPANVCNISCVECEVGTNTHPHTQGLMTLETYRKILHEIGPYLISAQLYRYGEPLLNKNILNMIDLAENKYGIYSSISTNFSMPLSEEFLCGLINSGLSQIVIAADDIQQAHYVKYRVGGDINQVIKNLKNLVRIRKKMNTPTPEIIWQSLIFNFNEDRKDEIEKHVKNLGVDSFNFIPAYISPKNYSLLPGTKNTRGRKSDQKSQVVNANVSPSVVQRGENFTLKVEVIQNIFKEPIPPSPKDKGIRIGIKFADKNKKELEEPNFSGRLLFEKPLAFGEKVKLVKTFPFPEITDYGRVGFLKIDLLMEHEFWFEQNMEIQSLPYFLEIEFKRQYEGRSNNSSFATHF